MKKVVLFLSMIITAATTFAGDLQPPSAPAPTMKTLGEVEPRIPISDATTPGDETCKYKITQPGSYYLTGNFTSNFKHGILINSSDVTLDLMGYRIYSAWLMTPPDANSDFDGIHINPEKTDIVIKNGFIVSSKFVTSFGTYKGFKNGIATTYDPFSPNITIENVTVTKSRLSGIDLSCCRAKVKNCVITENGENSTAEAYGICVGFASEVVDNFVSGNGRSASKVFYAVYTEGSSKISGNRIAENGYLAKGPFYGVFVPYSCIVSGNMVVRNGKESQSVVYGIRVGSGITAFDNVIMENGKQAQGNVYGLRVLYKCKVSGNTITRNGYGAESSVYGILSGKNCLITDNNVTENGSFAGEPSYGVKVEGSSLIDRNVIVDNENTNLSYYSSCTIGTNHAP